MSRPTAKRRSRRAIPGLESLERREVLSHLSVHAAAPDRAGNSRTTARNIGTLSPERTRLFNDAVGPRDIQDFYRFRVNATSVVKLSLTNLKANADMQLLRQNGKALKLAQRPGKAAEAIKTTLKPGVYFVRVLSKGAAETTYRLRLQATRPPQANPPANDPPPSNNPPANDPPANNPPQNDPPANNPPQNDPPARPTQFLFAGTAQTTFTLVSALTFQPVYQEVYRRDSGVLIRAPLVAPSAGQVESNPFNLMIFPAQASTQGTAGDVYLSTAEISRVGTSRELLHQYWQIERTADGFRGILADNQNSLAVNSQMIWAPALVVPDRPQLGVYLGSYSLYDGRYGRQFQTSLTATFDGDRVLIRVTGWGASGNNLAYFETVIAATLVESR